MSESSDLDRYTRYLAKNFGDVSEERRRHAAEYMITEMNRDALTKRIPDLDTGRARQMMMSDLLGVDF